MIEIGIFAIIFLICLIALMVFDPYLDRFLSFIEDKIRSIKKG